jgi:putative transposase
MRFGRLIIRRSTFCSSALMVNRQSPGSRLFSMITAAQWPDISFPSNRLRFLHTSLGLRQAIWRKDDPRWNVCGIPGVLYTDHGSDFTSRHLEQVGADLRIRLIFSMQEKPRGRGRIERFFSTLDEMFLCELDGYAPQGRGVRRKPRLTLSELDSRLRFFYWMCTIAVTALRPKQRRPNAGNGFLPRMPESLEQDLLLIQVAKSRRVHRDGIHFQGLR